MLSLILSAVVAVSTVVVAVLQRAGKQKAAQILDQAISVLPVLVESYQKATTLQGKQEARAKINSLLLVLDKSRSAKAKALAERVRKEVINEA